MPKSSSELGKLLIKYKLWDRNDAGIEIIVATL